VHQQSLLHQHLSITNRRGFQSPLQDYFFPEATCGNRAGGVVAGCFGKKRGLLDWFITKVAPSGNRFAGSRRGFKTFAPWSREDASTPRVEQTRVFVQHQETSVPLEDNRFFSNPIVEGLTFAYKTKMHCAPMSLHKANHHPRLQPRSSTCLKAIHHSSLSQCHVLMCVSG
jgi:hypothetical protein